jgi:nucleotide-binding universal stress UspA family protein
VEKIKKKMNEKRKPAAAARRRKIVVTVDAQSHLPTTVELAVALASATQGALHGLFVQDTDLLQVVKLPFAQEVPLLGGRPRSMSDQRLQRSLGKFADQFRRVLEDQAGRFALSCSYSVVQGRKSLMELEEAQGAEFLVHGQPQRGGSPSARSVGLRRYVLFADHCEEMLPALEILLERHRGVHTELILLSARGQLDEAMQSKLGALLTRYPEAVPTIVPLVQMQRVLAAPSPRVDCVITSAHMAPAEISQVLHLATCPVIIAESGSA